MSIEVLDGEFSARLWLEARGDSLFEAALHNDVIQWNWRHFAWGSVLEVEFADEQTWERFRANPAVIAALDAVPDRLSGLLIHRGRGGTSAPREPRRPRPIAGAGAAALEFPGEWTFEPLAAPPLFVGVRAVASV